MRHACVFRYKTREIAYALGSLSHLSAARARDGLLRQQSRGLPMKKLTLRRPRSRDLWINPKSNLRGVNGNRAWENEGNITPSTGSRFLELADIALGLRKPLPKKRKAAAAGVGTHDIDKKGEPYR